MSGEDPDVEAASPSSLSGQAFVAVRYDDHAWVVDLPVGAAPFVGPGEAPVVRVDDLARAQGTVRWDGEQMSLERTAKSPPIFVNGKRLESRLILRPGDELSIGEARMVVGLASQPQANGRRALTHGEFRERLFEELARAARRGRPTSLTMVKARSGDGGRVIEAALTHFRAGDVVATYAHDELELLFPDTPGEQADAVVTRVIGGLGLPGLSVGLAVAPHDADTPERLIRAARLALRARGDAEALVTRPPVRADRPAIIEPTAVDLASKAVVARLTELAGSEQPVLLTGEASSGKGVFARVLHESSAHAEGPYVVLRCASLVEPEGIDAALGPRGADLSGVRCRALDARGGTLVLDEVCELLPDPQERLLDVLDALDGSARLVASTHADLTSLAKRGAFSEALVDALAGAEVEVPALRSRPDDIVPLAETFAKEAGADTAMFSPGALARLRSHAWPGNVLELRNAMERAVQLATGGEILAEHLPSDGLAAGGGEGRLREHVDSIERDAIVKALADSNHNQTHAARRLGISRRALIYKMEKYGLKPPPGSARK